LTQDVGFLSHYSKKRDMNKTKSGQDVEREERITMEIIVDAYGPEEQAMGWYYYLEDKIHFPFTAVCNEKRAILPLHVGDEGVRQQWENGKVTTSEFRKDSLIN